MWPTVSICMCESSRGTVVREPRDDARRIREYTCERRGGGAAMRADDLCLARIFS